VTLPKCSYLRGKSEEPKLVESSSDSWHNSAVTWNRRFHQGAAGAVPPVSGSNEKFDDELVKPHHRPLALGFLFEVDDPELGEPSEFFVHVLDVPVDDASGFVATAGFFPTDRLDKLEQARRERLH